MAFRVCLRRICALVISVLVCSAFCGAVSFAKSEQIEDITPKYPQGWSKKNDSPEDIIPIIKSRNLKTLKIDKSESSKSAKSKGQQTEIKKSTWSARPKEKKSLDIPAIDIGDKSAAATSTAQPPASSTAQASQKKKEQAPPRIMKYRKKRPPLKRGPVSGHAQLKYQEAGASGDEVGFLSQHGLLLFNDTIQQSAFINIDEKYKSGMKVDGTLIDQPYQDPRFTFTAVGNNLDARLGDVTGRFTGGEMAGFSRQIRGLDVEYDFGPLSAFAVLSSGKSDYRRESFMGRNMRGPYSLGSSSILEGSEKVFLNGDQLSRDEYIFDGFLGQIMFRKSIDSTDRVDVSYESNLEVGIKTGTMNAIGLRTSGEGKYSGGVSYMVDSQPGATVETAHRATDSFASPVTGTIYTLSANYLKLYSEVVYVAAAGGNVYYKRGADYDIRYYTAEYGKGTIVFKQGRAPAAGTAFVKYEYYDESYLQRVGDGETEERIYGYGETIFQLKRERIYPGPEIVYLYINDGQRHRRLEPGLDYEISEANNSIVFLRDEATPSEIEGRYVVISYKIAPVNDQRAAGASRSVFDIYGSADAGALKMKAEIAGSSLDSSLKSVQIVEERIATVDDISKDVYPLQYDASPGTEEIYLNDAIFSGSRMMSGVDYALEWSAAHNGMAIRLLKPLRKGDTIIANYSYSPGGISGDVRSGKAVRFNADYSFDTGSAGVDMMMKSYYFVPNTSFSDSERNRMSLNFNTDFGRKLNVRFDYKAQQRNMDYNACDYLTSVSRAVGFKYRANDDTRMEYTARQITSTDQRYKKISDYSRWAQRLEAWHNPSNRQFLKTNFHVESRDFYDNTRRTAGQKMMIIGGGATYTPDETLQLSLTAETTNADYIAPPGTGANFSADAVSGILDAMWIPSPLWTVKAALDIQEKNASRSGSDSSESIHNIRASAFSKPIGKINRISVDIDRIDRPNPGAGDSRAESAALKVNYSLNPEWSLTPGLAITKSTVQERSASENVSAGLQADYRKGEQLGWVASAQVSSVNRESSRISYTDPAWEAGSSTQSRFSSTLKYLEDRYQWKNALNINGAGGSGGRSGGATTSFDYYYDENTQLAIGYGIDSAPYSGRRDRFRLSSSTILDDHFTLGLSYMREQRGGASSYNGDIFNMTLDMEF